MAYADRPAIQPEIIEQARDLANKSDDPYWKDKVMPFLRQIAGKTIRELTTPQRNWLHGIKRDLKKKGYF